jgi:hypothetical protein
MNIPVRLLTATFLALVFTGALLIHASASQKMLATSAQAGATGCLMASAEKYSTSPKYAEFRKAGIAGKRNANSDRSAFFVYQGKLFARVQDNSFGSADTAGFTIRGNISVSRHSGSRMFSCEGVSLGDSDC